MIKGFKFLCKNISDLFLLYTCNEFAIWLSAGNVFEEPVRKDVDLGVYSFHTYTNFYCFSPLHVFKQLVPSSKEFMGMGHFMELRIKL